jgi:ABC-type branched-subunit amino acid transport system substrate-binding protein
MRRTLGLRVVLLAVVLLAAACGNRAGDDDDAAPDDVGTTDETTVDNGGETDVGITATEIRIGVIADLTGVVPGLFKAAPEAVKAYAAMVNENGGIHGRQLVVEEFDTGTSDNGNRLAYEKACDKVFASVGSESAFDTGGYEAVAACGFPHLAGFATDPEVNKLDFLLPRRSDAWIGIGSGRWLAQEFPEAVKRAVSVYGQQAAAERGAKRTRESRSTVGWEYIYELSVSPLESNYTPHVLEMKNRGVQAFNITVDMNNIVRLMKALREQSYEVVVADASGQAYQQSFLDAAGPAANGAYIALDHAPLEERDLPAMDEYIAWLEKTSPDSAPSQNGLRAWTMAMLFTEAAEAVGPDLTRDALMDHIRGMTDWDADGLFPPRDLGQEIPDESCFIMVQVQDEAYVRVFPDEGFHCAAEDIYLLEDAGR